MESYLGFWLPSPSPFKIKSFVLKFQTGKDKKKWSLRSIHRKLTRLLRLVVYAKQNFQGRHVVHTDPLSSYVTSSTSLSTDQSEFGENEIKFLQKTLLFRGKL